MTNASAAVQKLIQKPIHAWDLQPPEAAALQTGLSRHVVRQKRLCLKDIDTVAGIDTAYRGDNAYAAVVVMKLPGLKLLEEGVAVKPVQFPYIPGLLSFRVFILSCFRGETGSLIHQFFYLFDFPRDGFG